MAVKSLFTYDPHAQVYRSWTFLSTGYTIERSGTFDTATKILALDGTATNGIASRATADFSDPDKIEWSIFSVAADGTQSLVNSGASKRTE